MMLLLIKRVVVLARDMLLAIAIDNVAFECLRVRLPSCIVMCLGSRSLLNLLAYVLFDVLHEEIYPSMVH